MIVCRDVVVVSVVMSLWLPRSLMLILSLLLLCVFTVLALFVWLVALLFGCGYLHN